MMVNLIQMRHQYPANSQRRNRGGGLTARGDLLSVLIFNSMIAEVGYGS
jgi:hypothetical protein